MILTSRPWRLLVRFSSSEAVDSLNFPPIPNKLTGSAEAGSYPMARAVAAPATEADAAVESVEAVDEAEEEDVEDDDESGGGRGGPEEPWDGLGPD